MKKLLLSGTALLLSLSLANAQGWSTTGAHDDFATASQIANGPNGEGLYWFETTGGTTLALSRTGDGTMGVAVTNAGACATANSTCYPVFGVNFGVDGSSVPYTMDLSTNADIYLDIQNTGSTFNFITVTLEDINGNKALFEPNVTDVTSTYAWGDAPYPRKALNGFTFQVDDNTAKTIHLDLTNGGTNVGGLTPGAYTCDIPANCPVTSYGIDITKIKTVIFSVNFGNANVFISEGDGDNTVDTFVPGNTITAYTGGYILSDFIIGTFVVTANQGSVDNNKLSVYPNPTKDILNVSYDAANGADITLTDMVGNKVLSTSASAGSTQVSLNTSNLQNGVYILNVSTENGKTSRKVSIQ
jgi:hypothetical protein